MPPKKVYHCDCQRYCDGQIRVVKKSTYFNHAKYRDPHSQFSPEFREWLNANPPLFRSSAYKDMQRSRGRVNGTKGGPQAGRMHQSPGDSNYERDNGDAVPASPLPGPSAPLDAPPSKGPSIRAPGEPHGISDGSSNGTSMSKGDDLSEAFDSSRLPSPDAAVHALEDPEANDNALRPLSGRSAGLSPDNVEDLWLQEAIHPDNLKLCAEFIKGFQVATLSDPSVGLSEEAVPHLRNPHGQSSPPLDPDLRLTLELYLINPSEATYETNRTIILRHFPHTNIPSYYRTTQLFSEITGIDA